MKFTYIRKHPILSMVGGAIVIIIGLSMVFSGGKEETYETTVVARDDLTQLVEVTGKVQPTEERTLAFERGGTVSRVDVSVGDIVVRGQRLVTLDTSELYAQLKQAEASVVQQQNMLAELKRGSRPEELAVSQTSVENAERALEDAQTAYEVAQEKAQTDLSSAYDGAITSAQSGVVSAKNALVSLSEIQYARFVQAGINDDDLSSKKANAMEKLFGISDAGGWTAESVSDLTSGVYAQAQTLAIVSNPELLHQTLENTLEAINAVSDALGAMPVLSTFSTTEKAELSTQKTTITAAITALSAKLQLIDVQNAANTSTLATVEAAITTAENALLQAQNELTLKEAGSTAEAIATGESALDAAVAQKDLILAQINKMILTAPIGGVVTKQEAKQGVFTQAGTPVVSIISENSYEVEVFIPEVDIAKVSLGDEVNITLDAYSDDDVFKATVASIDPAETVIEGVSTYKVVLDFVDKEDTRIRSGMTADAEIMTDSREGVLVVPTRAIRSNGHKYVRVMLGEEIEEREVSVGLKGSNGFSEITEGLTEGETIISFSRN